jgi:hypothetical protein
MSTSLLYHAFGIPSGYEYQSSRYEKGEITFIIREKRSLLRCSNCNSCKVNLRGSRTRKFRTLPIGDRPCWIEYAVPGQSHDALL